VTVKLIEHLSDLNNNGPVLAISPKVAAPATDKLVIVQVLSDKGLVLTIGARYREGRWYGEKGGEDLTDEILNSPNAVWAESFLFPESAIHRHVNTK
jgi:hypothetical protein